MTLRMLPNTGQAIITELGESNDIATNGESLAAWLGSGEGRRLTPFRTVDWPGVMAIVKL